MNNESMVLRYTARLLVGLWLAVTAAGCKELLTGKPDESLPAGVSDPKAFDTPNGALALYRSATGRFEEYSGSFSITSGLLSDELRSNRLNRTLISNDIKTGNLDVDARSMSTGEGSAALGSGAYNTLQGSRTDLQLAYRALHKQLPTESAVLQGHTLALTGYAEIQLADLFCSGVPLSTVDFEKDITYAPGSTTREVYTHALALFDSALALSADSIRIMNLARVGKARVLVNLGRYAEAAAVAALVPNGFDYRFKIRWWSSTALSLNVTTADREGGNGLAFISSKDPRTTVTYLGITSGDGGVFRDSVWWPSKFGVLRSISDFPLASATESRLIEAEAALHENNISGWLARLNALRTDSTYTISGTGDTLWRAGTGGVARLAPLRDPGALLAEPAKTDARIDLLFAERGFWLLLTGRRQGDLRRLVRAVELGGYGRDEERVYPTGPYVPGPLIPTFGHAVNLSIPSTEFRNDKFTGCQGRGA